MCAFLLTRSQWIAEGRQLIRESSDDLEKMNTLLCDLGRAVEEGSKRVHGKQKKRDSPIAPPQTVRALAYADVIAVMRGLYQRLKDNNFERLDRLPYVRVVFFMAHLTHACSTSLSTSVWHAPHTPQGASLLHVTLLSRLLGPFLLRLPRLRLLQLRLPPSLLRQVLLWSRGLILRPL